MLSLRPMNALASTVQRSAKRLVRGCEKFIIALAYLFCLALPGSCLARFAYFLADLCTQQLCFEHNIISFSFGNTIVFELHETVAKAVTNCACESGVE